MENPQTDPLVEFGKYLDDQLADYGVSQSELARQLAHQVGKLPKNVVSLMIAGSRSHLTPNNMLRFLKGLVLLEKITEPKYAANLWKRLHTARMEEDKFRPLEEIAEGRELLDLIEQVQADRERALEKPKYTTSQGIPVIGRDEDIEKILTLLQEERFLVLVGLPGVGKTELARLVGIEAKKQGHFKYVPKPLALAQETSPDAVITRLTQTLTGIQTQIRTLLILDNCEQIKGLAGALRDFLDKHEHVSILATSSKRMRRNDFPVLPLEVPETVWEPIETLQTRNAVKLFLESVNVNKDKDNKFKVTEDNAQLIAAFCIGLDGLPLGLCLVGSLEDAKTIDGLREDFLSGKIYGLNDPYNEHDRHMSLHKCPVPVILD
jgi:hypothetical protein